MTHALVAMADEARAMVRMLDEKISDMLANITLLRAELQKASAGMARAWNTDTERCYSARWDKLYACLLATIDQCQRSTDERAQWVELTCGTLQDNHCLACDADISPRDHGVCFACRLGVTL